MHSDRPLHADYGTLGNGQDGEGERQCQRPPDGSMDPDVRSIGHFNPEHGRDNHVADDEDGEIGRGVVRAVVMEFFAALTAIVSDFQIFPEYLSLATRRAFEGSTSADGPPD